MSSLVFGGNDLWPTVHYIHNNTSFKVYKLDATFTLITSLNSFLKLAHLANVSWALLIVPILLAKSFLPTIGIMSKYLVSSFLLDHITSSGVSW